MTSNKKDKHIYFDLNCYCKASDGNYGEISICVGCFKINVNDVETIDSDGIYKYIMEHLFDFFENTPYKHFKLINKFKWTIAKCIEVSQYNDNKIFTVSNIKVF